MLSIFRVVVVDSEENGENERNLTAIAERAYRQKSRMGQSLELWKVGRSRRLWNPCSVAGANLDIPHVKMYKCVCESA